MLADILSLYGIHSALNEAVENNVLNLRLVSRNMKVALESNSILKINIRINDAGMKGLTANFLQRWHGGVHLYCTRQWEPCETWINEVRDALASGRLRPLSLLSLVVKGNNLHPLANLLTGIESVNQQLEISYCGNGTELCAAAAPLEALGRALTMEISIQGRDRGQVSSCLQHLLESNIRISSISLRLILSPTHYLPCRSGAASAHDHNPNSRPPLAALMEVL